MTKLFILLLITTGPRAAAESLLDRQIGQMLMVGVVGSSVKSDDRFHDLICRKRVGALILFDYHPMGRRKRNIESPRQLARLTRDIHRLAARCGSGPMLLAVDMEGGGINRLKPQYGFPKISGHAALGRSGSPAKTRKEGRKIGKLLKSMGIQWNLAPVLDVNLNSDNPIIARYGRSFSSDPEKVAAHAQAYIRGMNESGILNAAKHFPGHGSSWEDSHTRPVDVTNLAQLQVELLPYQRLVGQGLLDAVMPGHLLNRNIDPRYPASLSRATIQGILRNRLKFRGVVLTEDLHMAAILHRYSLDQAAVLAVQAGADMLLVSNGTDDDDQDLVGPLISAVKAAVEKGAIPRARIKEANARIGLLKKKTKR